MCEKGSPWGCPLCVGGEEQRATRGDTVQQGKCRGRVSPCRGRRNAAPTAYVNVGAHPCVRPQAAGICYRGAVGDWRDVEDAVPYGGKGEPLN